MAKKKTFDNIVDDSFKDGYDSDPVIPPQFEKEGGCLDSPLNDGTAERESAEKPLTENEILLQKILSDDSEALANIYEKKDRSTYYLTDLHRACIEEAARVECVKKNDIVILALERFFDEMGIVPAAKARAVEVAVQNLKKEIKKEKANK